MITLSGFGRRSRISTSRWVTLTAVAALIIGTVVGMVRAPAAAASTGSPCGTNVNPIACENSQTSGVVPQSVWDVAGAGDSTIQGFATDISVDAGSPISFKIKTTLTYTIDIYRLGYYGGNGARLWQGNLPHVAANQPACLTDSSTLLYDCGNWAVSATWNVPSNAVSGVFIAKLTATNGDDSQIPFVVRNDASTSDIVYQTSDPTWEAYNTYGGSDFYTGTKSLTGSGARAFKISYNRPFLTRGGNNGRDFLFSNEYPTIRYLERNGYDVSYIAGVDTDRYGATLLTKHKVFLSVGHDEYWSQAQRTNVENARDAGVNLMFLSGNEIYWHTRYEKSIDGSNTSYRTLVCYKETWDNAKIDPTSEWTGTWRDPRFANAPGGANPENGLTGTLYKANSDDLPLSVTAAEGKMRLWRGTGLGSMSGSSTTLAPHIVGYESDEDLDNGFRPAGLIDLSTSTGSTPQYLTDFGNTVVPGTTTHHVTLYRAASGALVFGAGTIQWGWGLDQDHDGDNSNPADVRMQQATANMLADMHALPTTLMAGLTMPSPSTDSQPPTVTVNSPAPGAIANGTQVTVSGTATDNGGGVVAGVEVSLDGGNSWHPATGTASWTYTGILHGDTSSMIKVRATDDSANTSTPTTVGVTAACPCSLFGNATPSQPDSGDGSAVELGVRFTSSEDGYVTGVRFYKSTANTGTHVGSLWTASGSLLASGTFTNESASGWQTLQLASPVAVSANTTYVVSYWAPNGHYSDATDAFYYKPYDAAPLHAANTTPDATSVNGVYATSHGFPTNTYRATNYFVDVLFSPSSAVPPTVTSVTPMAGASSVPTSVTPTATFSKTIDPTTLTFTLTDPSGTAVPSTVTYDSTSKTATLTPKSALADGVLYTASVSAKDTSGNSMTAPMTWNFRTAYAGQVGGACPCTIFTDSTVPSTVTYNDPNSVELGVKFTADTDGIVTGVRFYKGPQNGGTHTGSLWSADGTQLASAVFTNESSTGWQTVTFANPVQVKANTTYIASYRTTVGFYSATAGAYSNAGFDNFPLHVPQNGGVYTYGAGFPNNSSSADYGVDVIFNVPASVVPSVTSTDPGDGDTNIPVNTQLTVHFSTAILGGTTSISMSSADGTNVTGAVSLNSAHDTLTFTPSAALSTATSYTVTEDGARSLAGTPQASPVTWTFTTSGSTTCPCSLFASNAAPSVADSGDGSDITVGVKVVPATAGYLTGMRFYKAAANTGTHTGSIWDSSGNRLAEVTFANETASGWQKATFSAPVPVSAGQTYTVGYHAPNGHYSATANYFANDYVNGLLTVPGGSDGVYTYGGDLYPTSSYRSTNYWVDVVFSTTAGTDTVPPTVSATAPIDGATSVSTSITPSATFSEAIKPASLTMTLTSAGTPVAGNVSYDTSTNTATFTPTSALPNATKYVVSVSASDLAGNAMTSPATWSFTTAQPDSTPGVCPCSVWNDSTTPAVITDKDSSSVELGMKFSADVNGQITGVRFYKGPSNTGTHTATLWSANGDQLATGTFTNESTTGWQTLHFATPVSITAGTTYVVSYHAPKGAFSYNSGYFSTTGVDNSPLHVPAHAALYLYGSGSFPTNASDNNYWVDPIFMKSSGTAPAADTAPPVISALSATATGSTLTITWTTDESSSSRVDYGTSASNLSASATGAGSTTTHSVAVNGIAPNTRYYYRVTSTDASNNSATSPAPTSSPASWAPTTAPLTDTTTSDFSGGASSATFVSTNGGGEVVLNPTAVAEFNGSVVPAGWTTTVGTNGSVVVAGGTATLINSTMTSTTTYGSGRSLETSAVLQPNHSIGWVTSSNSNVNFSFAVNAAKQLVATVNDGGTTNVSAVVATGWAATSHTYRIDWTSTSVTFFVDDKQVYKRTIVSRYTNMRPQLGDSVSTDVGLVVNWIRVGPYTASGTFTSHVLDARASVIWDGLTWDSSVPTGTTVTVRVRTGDTAVPDASWSAYHTVTASGGAISATSRYLQYQVTLTSSGSRFVTPALKSVSAAFHV